MRIYCTLSDKNYLAKGLALYKSLMKHCSQELTLYYLCLDQESYNILYHLKLPRIVFQSLPEIEKFNPELTLAKSDRPYNEYAWTLASWYINHIISPFESVTYLDSDLYFYSPPETIFQEIGDKSVGIIAHRHNSPGSDRDGAYNVGLIYFKNDKIGRECLAWWSDAVLNKKYPEYFGCGDQKYLEGFSPKFGSGNICIADQTFAHGAPWNYRLYTWDLFETTGTIRWGSKTQTFIFNHFSRFSYDLSTNTINPTSGCYLDHTLGGGVYNIPQVLKLQQNYYAVLKEIHETWLRPRAPAIIDFPKVAFGTIVFEGDYVLKQSLDSVYPFAYQILVAEGPVAWWQSQDRETSTDDTNKILDSYPDPAGKLKVVHGKYQEKDEQCSAYMAHLKSDADFIWNLDSDEVFKPEDVESLIKIMHDEKYTSAGIRSCTFYGGFDRYITGFEELKDQFLRVFRIFPGSKWLTHRPPTIVHAPGTAAIPKHLDSDTLFDRTGIRMYHYSYIYPRQVFNKVTYYGNAFPKGKAIDDYFINVYLPWIKASTDEERKAIEDRYQGVHEYKPQFRTPTYTARFEGFHPSTIRADFISLLEKFESQKELYARP